MGCQGSADFEPKRTIRRQSFRLNRDSATTKLEQVERVLERAERESIAGVVSRVFYEEDLESWLT